MSARALVVADGAVAERPDLERAWPGCLDGIDLVVAADGGLRHARRLGLRLDAWVGDADSVEPAELDGLAAAGVPVRRLPSDKDESDTELAIREVLARGATEVTILGALGGPRLDHALANVRLLGHRSLIGARASLLDASVRIRLVDGPGRLELAGRLSDLVTLLPFDGDVAGVTTSGLRYPMSDEGLEAGSTRGLSNVRVAPVAVVSVRSGRLLVVETPATLPA